MTTTAQPSAAERAAAFGLHSLTPHLVCAGAAAAIDFYKAAFGAEELMRLPAPDGSILHACIRVNGSSVMLVDENRGCGLSGPKALGGTAVTLHLVVDDVDAAVDRAITAGAVVVMPVADQFWGDRYGVIADPFGHQWSLATPGAPKSPEDLAEAAAAAMEGV